MDSPEFFLPPAEQIPFPSKRFRLLKRLGTGGMGVVYQAFDERRGLTVALKTLEKLSLEGMILLKREFRIAAGLRHPNLVRLYDLFVSSSQCFFTMELVLGQNLVSFVRGTSEETPTVLESDIPTQLHNESAFTRDERKTVVWSSDSGASYDGTRLLAVFPQLCAALDTLHQEGIVHRDVKPGNVLISEESRVKLLDFGIATPINKVNESLKLPNEKTGTPHYMAPEQIRGQKIGIAADLYSLGVLLYRLLTGQNPFTGENPRQILKAHLRETPVPPSKLIPSIPEEIEEICLELLAKKPEDRPGLREVVTRLVKLGAEPAFFVKPQFRRFIGRKNGLLRLYKESEIVQDGKKRGVLIYGESGAGKSAICAEMVHSLAQNGWNILTGRCYARERVPYNVFDPLIDAITHTISSIENPSDLPKGIGFLGKMFPILFKVPGIEECKENKSASEEKKEARHALGKLLALVAGEDPLVLWLDDLQWADTDSLTLLASLFEEEETPPFLLLGTYRDTEVSPEHSLSVLQERPQVTSLQLSPLSVEEIAALLGEKATAFLVEKIAEESQGNAFLASELSFASSTLGETGGLVDILISRLGELGGYARTVLEVIVTAGASVSFATLRKVTRLAPPSLSFALDDLRSERWIQAIDDRKNYEEAYDTYHDRIREVFYQSLSEERCIALHYAFGESLKEEGEPEVVADHYLLAKKPKLALPWLVAAAKKASAQLALRRAAVLYQRILQIAGEESEFSSLAREEQAKAFDRIGGCYAEAASSYRMAAKYEKGAKAVQLLLKAAEADLKRGEVEAALEAAIEAMAPYETLVLPKGMLKTLTAAARRTIEVEWRLKKLKTLPNREISEQDFLKHLFYHRMGATLSVFDMTRSIFFATRALSLALSRGSNESVVDAMGLYGIYSSFRRGRKNLNRAKTLLQKAHRWRDELRDPEMKLWLELQHGMLACFAGQFAEAIQILPPVLEEYRSLGHLSTFPMAIATLYLGMGYGGVGQPEKGIKVIRTLFEQAAAEGDLMILRILAPPLNFLYIRVGKLEKAKRVDLMVPRDKRYSSAFDAALAVHRGELLLALGHRKDSMAILERLIREPLKKGVFFFKEQGFRGRLALGLSLLAEARYANNHSLRLDAVQRAKTTIRPVVTSDDPLFEGPAFRLMGLLAHMEGDTVSVRPWLDRAIASLSESGDHCDLVSALLTRGALLGNSEDISKGKVLLESSGWVDPAIREGKGWSWE